MEETLNRLFHLKERGTSVRTEMLAGLTTFVTAAYVLAVNPSIMSAAGMDAGSVFTATALVCFLGTCVMALLTNYPFVLVPSMGLNAYFAYTVVLGILITWVLGIVCELCGIYVPDAAAGYASLLPDFSNGLAVPSIAPTFLKMDFSQIANLGFLVVTFAFLLTSLFDTVGSLIGLGAKAELLDEEGNMPAVRGAMTSESVATMIAGLLGNSATCCSVECAAGIAEGGRTGLMALTTGVLFLLSMFLSPIFLAIPSFATAPALVVVGFLMASSVLKIDFNDPCEGIPAFLCFMGMPLCYSIVEGISLGIISYVLINLLCGNRKKISPMMYVLAVVFVLKYVLI